MLFVGYPKLTPVERLAELPALLRQGCCINPTNIINSNNSGKIQTSLRLTTIAGVPSYVIGFNDKSRLVVNAITGNHLSAVNADYALASAKQFSNAPHITYDSIIQYDSWTLSKALDPDRPLHRVSLNDKEQRLLYISSSTGEVIRDATRHERLWNFAGAWLHWLYPLRNHPWWANTVIYLSLAATIMMILGQIIGLLRWRFHKPYRNGSHSPYKETFSYWHHLSGLIFGFILIAWIFSGLMSMQPWGLLKNKSQLPLDTYQGGNLQLEQLPVPVTDILQRLHSSGLHASELEWRNIGGKSYVIGTDKNNNSQWLPMDTTSAPQRLFPVEILLAAARTMWPQGDMITDLLSGYDTYYYARAQQSMYGHNNKRLPVLRIKFNDPDQTWVYIDLHSGAIVTTIDNSSRFGRWAFNFLHSWDLQVLLERPLLREVLMIIFSVGGLLISATAIVLGWRRILFSLRKIK